MPEVVVFRIQTAARPHIVLIGMSGSEERAGEMAAAAVAAMHRSVEVVPIVASNPVWTGVEL